ncbi:hypothetical protein PMAYCL1PPCAC_28497, partial [Pristionchus mayeri]
ASARNLTEASAPAGGADENLPPGGGGRKDSEAVVRLEARVAELEKREKKQKAAHLELQKQFEHAIQIVTKLTERIAILEVEKGEKGGAGRRSCVESVVERTEYDEDPRHRRRLYSSDEEGREREREKERRGSRGREEKRPSGRRTSQGHELLGNEDRLRALERQMASNPMLRRQMFDAIDQDKYEYEYGERRRTTHSPIARRGAGMYDDDEYEQMAPSRGGTAPTQRWREQRERVTPPGGTGGRGGTSRKRTDNVTPSRRRVTERVTMERVHHFDDTDESYESEGGGYDGHGSDKRQTVAQTEYEEEIVSHEFPSLANVNGRGGGYGHKNQQQHHGGRGGPVITELDGSEDEMVKRRRQLRERMESRGGRK